MNEIQRYEAVSVWSISKDDSGSYVDYDDHTAIVAQLEADLAEARKAGLASQAQQPTDISKQLREYAADSGYSHNDYADTMLAAASEIERLTTSQAQQESQWISVEERLPDEDVFVDVYIRSRSNTNFMQRETSVPFVSGKFKINRIFDCEYVSHWMPLPPAPMNEVNKPEGCKE